MLEMIPMLGRVMVQGPGRRSRAEKHLARVANREPGRSKVQPDVYLDHSGKNASRHLKNAKWSRDVLSYRKCFLNLTYENHRFLIEYRHNHNIKHTFFECQMSL